MGRASLRELPKSSGDTALYIFDNEPSYLHGGSGVDLQVNSNPTDTTRLGPYELS